MRANHAEDFHLRLVGGGDVNVSLVHSRDNHDDQHHRLNVGSVHYAALKAPQKGDRLTLRNEGIAPVEVHVAAPGGEDLLVHEVAHRRT